LPQCSATIIPLAPASRPGSSNLPEGSSCPAARATAKGALLLSQKHPSSRASSPLLFGLAPRGVCHALDITAEAVGSYPTFSPLPTSRTFEDVPKVFLRAITGLRAAGGIVSVALSVNSSTGFSLCLLLRRHIPRAPPKLRRLESVLPLPWRYQAHCPPLLAQSGVRTFLPPSPLARSRPAIVQLTRQFHYIARSAALIGIVTLAKRDYFTPSSFSNSPSVSTVTPNSFALSYFDPGSVPTTT
jgi:hypothetical protein